MARIRLLQLIVSVVGRRRAARVRGKMAGGRARLLRGRRRAVLSRNKGRGAISA